MKIKPKFNSKLAKLLRVEAITLYPYIFFAHDEEYSMKYRIIAHEMVHIEQVRRLGFLKMYWLYLVDYLRLRLTGKNHFDAYLALTLEAEAYDKQDSMTKKYNDMYLKEK